MSGRLSREIHNASPTQTDSFGYLLGVVGAVLGVYFKVFTLRRHKTNQGLVSRRAEIAFITLRRTFPLTLSTKHWAMATGSFPHTSNECSSSLKDKTQQESKWSQFISLKRNTKQAAWFNQFSSLLRKSPTRGQHTLLNLRHVAPSQSEKERGNNWNFFVPESLIEMSTRRGRCL